MLVSASIVFLCQLFSAFFSAAETAITAVSAERIFQLVQEGDKRAIRLAKLRSQKEAVISAILLGNNVLNILASALAASVAIEAFGNEGVLYATAVMTVLIVVFAEVLPKTYAIRYAEKTALAMSRLLSIVFFILYPISRALNAIIFTILRIFRVPLENLPYNASDIIRGTIEMHHQDGHVVKHDRDMLGTILDLDEIELDEIMIHRLEMETIDASQAVDDIIHQAIQSTHSRIPLWKDEPDNIIGILHVKSLLKELRANRQLTHDDLMAIVIKPWFVPETTSLKEQLHAFRKERQHLALVVDEYGDIKGMVTLEDIIEEIVGNIDDEYDHHVPSQLFVAGENAYIVDGAMTLRDLNRHVDWNLPDDDANTVAGLILHEAREIPEVGASFVFHDVRFDVVRKRDNRITRVRIEKMTMPESSAQNA